MDTSKLISFTADYWHLNPTDVRDDLAFNVTSIPKFSSMRFFRFLAAFEDTFGVRVSDPGSVITYSALKSIITHGASGRHNGHAEMPDQAADTRASTLQSGISAIGHDIEEIASLPETTDYRAEPFYRSHFTAREIEYCMRSTNPRQHFAARFCAKEALRKCGPMFAALDPRSIEVVNTESGQPTLQISQLHDSFYPRVFLSLSHSEQLASAFVIVTSA
jgi:holo-[acyl-carrier protein] synthase